jgi:predicted Zn-dependent protease
MKSLLQLSIVLSVLSLSHAMDENLDEIQKYLEQAKGGCNNNECMDQVDSLNDAVASFFSTNTHISSSSNNKVNFKFDSEQSDSTSSSSSSNTEKLNTLVGSLKSFGDLVQLENDECQTEMRKLSSSINQVQANNFLGGHAPAKACPAYVNIVFIYIIIINF